MEPGNPEIPEIPETRNFIKKIILASAPFNILSTIHTNQPGFFTSGQR